MKRHPILFLAAAGAMIAMAALSPQNSPRLLVLEWAAKAAAETPPAAVLIELGLKDQTPTPWAGSAKVTGARIVHREGYRFRTGDRLIDPGGWQASSHRPLRLPPRRPDLTLLEGIAGVGIVLHLADVKPDAELILDTRGKTFEQAIIPLKDVLAGQTKLVWGGAAAVRLISTASPVVTAKTEDDFPAAAYGPDVTLWLAYISYTVRDESRRIEQQPLKEPPADFKAF